MTSHDFTRFKGLQGTSRDFKGLHRTLWDFKWLRGTSRDFEGLQETSRDLKRLERLQETSRDFKGLQETSRDCKETFMDFKRLHYNLIDFKTIVGLEKISLIQMDFIWAIPRKPQPKVLNRYPQIWPIFIYVIEGWILWILAKAASKNIEPFGFYRIFTESTRKCTFSTDDFATHKK